MTDCSEMVQLLYTVTECSRMMCTWSQKHMVACGLLDYSRTLARCEASDIMLTLLVQEATCSCRKVLEASSNVVC